MRLKRCGRLTQIALIGLGLMLAVACGWAVAGDTDNLAIGALLSGFGALLVTFQPLLGIYATLLLSPLKTYDFGSGLFSLTRIVGLGTALAALAYFATHRKRFRASGIEMPILLIILGISLSFLRTTNIEPVALSIISLMSLYTMLFLIVNLVDSEAQLRNLLVVFLISAILPVGLALAQWSNLVGVADYFIRVRGTFTLPTGLGAFLIPITLMAFPLILCPAISRPLRWLTTAIFGSGFVALILTFTRGAWIGFLMGFVLFFFTPVFGRRAGRRRLFSLVPLFLVLGAIWAFYPLIEARFVAPLWGMLTSGTSDKNILSRQQELPVGFKIIADNYFLGTGIGRYGQAVRQYQQLQGAWLTPPRPHNIVFYFFGEVGIVGAAGFIWLVIWLVRCTRSSFRDLTETVPSVTFYIYVGSLASLVGYVSFMITHSGFYSNEIWIAIALLIVSARLGQNMVQRRPLPPGH